MTSRKCEQCKHFIIAKAGEGKIYGCDRSKCVFEPTTKNDLPHCQYTDEEIAKSFREDVEAVKDQLPCFCEQMDFPNTFEEFAKDYGFKDKDEIYTNGSELIPVFRVRQWLEHISTTKNDLGVDCISRADAIQAMQDKAKKLTNEDTINGLCGAVAILFELPSVTPQPRWIPLTKRPMTDEEIEHYFEYTDMRIDDTYTILDCPLPDDGQEVLISWGGNVGNDVFIQDNEGCYFEGVDIDEVDAWMPLPSSYSEVEE